jgi:hypothetical protein
MDAKTREEIIEIRKRQQEKKELALSLSCLYSDAIVLRKEQPGNESRPWVGAIIHPSSRTLGRWQISIFDLDGFAYDYSEKTYQDAIYQALTEGFRTVEMDLLDNIGETARFMAGVIWSQLPDDKKWTTRISDIRERLELQGGQRVSANA